MTEALSTLAASLVVSVATAFLAVRLALGRYYTERWWERRLDAYIRVHDALSVQLRHASADYDQLTDYQLSATYTQHEILPSPVPEDAVEDMRKSWRTSERELADALLRGTFLLSEEAVRILRTYLEEHAEITRSMTDLEEERLEAYMAAAQNAVKEFGEQTKRDLSIVQRHFRRRQVSG